MRRAAMTRPFGWQHAAQGYGSVYSRVLQGAMAA
jgi:hypothetical protein